VAATGLTFPALRQALQRGRVEPVYLLTGEETWFHDEAIRLLEEAVVPPEAAIVNRQAVRGPEIDLVALVDLAMTFPMGPGRRLVVVRQADALRPDGLEELKAYLEAPNPRTCLVFSDEGFDERRALFRALQAGAVRVDCLPIADPQTLATWARDRLRARGYGLSPELAEAIGTGLLGAGLQRLDAELQKLMSAVGAPRPIAADDLEILADVPRIADAFQAARATLGGRRGEAIRAIRALLEEGQEAPMLLGALAWSVRTALKTRAALERRTPPRDLQADYGLHPGRIDSFRGEAALPLRALRRAVALCLEADREIKGGGARDPLHAFERLVHGVARARQGRS
jgi:DNA polymerase-3 subunit delta